MAICDTALPRGGGLEGKSLLFITKGTPVVYNVYGLHRKQEVYGADAEEFNPRDGSRPDCRGSSSRSMAALEYALAASLIFQNCSNSYPD